MIVFAFGALLYNDGAKTGMDDVAFAIALAQQEAGKEVTEEDRNRCFHPQGILHRVDGALPLILISLVFAFIATEQRYQLGSCPAGWKGLSGGQMWAALQYHQQHGLGLEGVLRIIVRLLLFPTST